MRVFTAISILLIASCLSACSWSNFPFLYKPDVQQGNVLDPGRVAELKLGMNRDEVVYLMGNPVLVNVLDTNETQYVYTMQVGKGEMTEKKLILVFAQDKLVNIIK